MDNLGRLFEIAGDFGKAERTMVAAAELRSNFSGENRLEYAGSLNNLGSLYRNLGNIRNAESYFVEARNIYSEILGAQSPQYATAINNLAQVYRISGKTGEAEALYNEAAQIYLNYYGEDHPLYATALNNLARLYRGQGKDDQARELYEKTIEIDKKSLGPKHPQYATSLTNLGVLYMAGAQTDKAEPLYKEALDIRRESLGKKHPQYARSLNNLALLYLANDRLVEAEPLFTEAIQVQIESIKSLFPSLSEKEKEDYYKTVRLDQERFNTLVVLLERENPKIIAELFNNQLATKAMLFSATDKMRRTIMASGDKALIQEFLEWRNLKADLARYYQVGKDELEKRKINLEDLENHANDLEKSLSLRSEIFAHETDQRKYTWHDIQASLAPDEAVIEIIRFREFGFRKTASRIDFGFTPSIHYVALVVTKGNVNGPDLVLLENGDELEAKYLSNYKNSLKFRVEDWYSYDQYWAKIAEKLKGINKVFISPDGVFNKLNPNVFYDTKTGKFLIDELDVEQVTNSKDILEKTVKENPIRTAVMIGNPDYDISPEGRRNVVQGKPYVPQTVGGYIDYTKIKYGYQYFVNLPGAQEEIVKINEITSSHNWENQTYMKATALEEVVKAVQSPKVLHIATHGFFSQNVVNSVEKYGVSADNPLFQSGLMLAGSGNTVYQRQVGGGSNLAIEDGILTAFEAMNLNLDNTDLVVLSACETGLGEVRNGEGVYGLERAFKVAGAKSIIMSLVKVQDQATKELMMLFYQDWVELGNKREAFQKAQKEFRLMYDDPYIWGAFVMIGD